MRWRLSPDSPLVIANPDPVPAVIDASTGGLLALLVLSPSGRYSGRDLNPAVTVALWRLKLFPGRAGIPYITTPTAGSLAGTAFGGLAWVTTACHAPVAVRPAPTWNATAVFKAEAGAIVAGTIALGAFLSAASTLDGACRTPWAWPQHSSSRCSVPAAADPPTRHGNSARR
ncbi:MULTISPECIES: aquaporin [unclassified Streptomyces]|uniref:aquaporin n=1 Tax=unclassified Streptomyces TaxID=2593676 RepID=UPI0013DE5F59